MSIMLRSEEVFQHLPATMRSAFLSAPGELPDYTSIFAYGWLPATHPWQLPQTTVEQVQHSQPAVLASRGITIHDNSAVARCQRSTQDCLEVCTVNDTWCDVDSLLRASEHCREQKLVSTSTELDITIAAEPRSDIFQTLRNFSVECDEQVSLALLFQVATVSILPLSGG